MSQQAINDHQTTDDQLYIELQELFTNLNSIEPLQENWKDRLLYSIKNISGKIDRFKSFEPMFLISIDGHKMILSKLTLFNSNIDNDDILILTSILQLIEQITYSKEAAELFISPDYFQSFLQIMNIQHPPTTNLIIKIFGKLINKKALLVKFKLSYPFYRNIFRPIRYQPVQR